jgi:transketolase C-terminal domain/subunit
MDIAGCTVFYPTDPVATERATELAANTRGICFIRHPPPPPRLHGFMKEDYKDIKILGGHGIGVGDVV